MPLPYTSMAWPPASLKPILAADREYSAWYSGKQDELQRIYGGTSAPIPRIHPSQYRGGLVGSIARMWWGRPITPTQGTTRIHMPAAADLSALSADMLYSEPLSWSIDDTPAGPAVDRWSTIVDRSCLASRLLEMAEMCSYSGGAYLIAYVDISMSDAPMVAVYGHDVAVPEWRHGRLTAVTFWRALTDPDRDGSKVYRHLERHEVMGSGPGAVGMVYHGLYLGSSDELGIRVDLASRPETAQFASIVEPETGGVPTGASRLDVVYVPNVRPNRDFKGSPYGRSDYASVMSEMDALDETWSSWMRDIRLAKGRMVIPSSYVQSGGPGQGGYFDAEQEIFTAVNMLNGPDQGMQLSVVQFAIRVDEHERTAAALWRSILRGAGLSQGAFGEETGGPAATATEISARGGRTRDTRSRKIMYARDALRDLASVMAELDATHFGGDGMAQGMAITPEWPAELPDPESTARTIQLLDSAGAVSDRTKVAMAHPRWSPGQVDDEVLLISDARKADRVPVLPPVGSGDTVLDDMDGIE